MGEGTWYKLKHYDIMKIVPSWNSDFKPLFFSICRFSFFLFLKIIKIFLFEIDESMTAESYPFACHNIYIFKASP